MSWSTNPRMEFLRYYLKKFHVPFLLLPVFITSSLWLPRYYREAFRAPETATYQRPDAAGVEVALRGDTGEYGLTKSRQRVISNVLDVLPLDHVRHVKFIGVIGNDLFDDNAAFADESGALIFDGRSDKDSFTFTNHLAHEIGHRVHKMHLSDKERHTWQQYFRRSRGLDDHVSTYAMTDINEDFAESYESWVGSAYAFQFMATEAAQRGSSTLLERYLFMAGVFFGADRNIKTYAHSVGSDSNSEGWDRGMPLVEVADRYYRTEDALTIDAYTYRLNGNHIVSIEDRRGETIASGLNITVPENLWKRLEYTEPAPLLEPPQVAAVMCDPGAEPGTCRAPEIAEIDHSFQVTSPNDPRHYVPIESEAGRHALAGEQAMTWGPNKLPTNEDLVRPHGVVISR